MQQHVNILPYHGKLQPSQQSAVLVQDKSRVLGAIQVNVPLWQQLEFPVQCIYTWV